MSPNELLAWLMTSSGSIAAFSWIAEQFPKWHEVKAEVKKWYSFAGSAVIALSAWATVKFASPELLDAIYEPFSIIAGIFMIFFVGQVFHKATK